MAQFQLVLRVGPSPGKVFPLMKNEVTIGRDINNEIVINDAEVSRKHCRLKMYGEGFIIEDLGSTNGTWVNEQRISGQHQLRSGEMIRLGDNITLTYEMVGFDADATIASGAELPFSQQQTMAPQQVPPMPPPQQQAQQPRPQQPRPPQQYAGQTPSKPAQPKLLGMNRNVAIILAVLVILLLCLVAFLIYVDSNCLWCEITWNLLPGCPYTAACP